jgi:hypothetical protein
VPVEKTAIDSIDLDDLHVAAKAAAQDVIRSHGWKGMVEDADLLRTDERYLVLADPAVALALIEEVRNLRQMLQQPRVPNGFALVPQSMLLSKDLIGVINFHCGDTDQEEGGQFGQYTDGRLWVGYVLDDDGNKVHGLHIATDEYPEEGSTTLVEFTAVQP